VKLRRTDRPGLSLETLEALEKRLGVRLPEPWRAFLLEHDGGVPEGGSVPWPAGSDGEECGWELGELFGVGGDDALSTIEGNIAFLQEVGRWPGNDRVLPIGMDEDRSFLFVVGMDGARRGHVFCHSTEGQSGTLVDLDGLDEVCTLEAFLSRPGP